MGEDFEYVDTFMKGKDTKIKVENIRLLLRGVKTGTEMFFFIYKRENFFGQDRFIVEQIELSHCKKLTNDHYKFKNYNYYRKGKDSLDVEFVFTLWADRDPMVHVGNYTHQFISKISGYKGSYKFEDKIY